MHEDERTVSPGTWHDDSMMSYLMALILLVEQEQQRNEARELWAR